ncbi:hypothetical protein ACOSQ3_007085 [Xanthoceras sorbifolium]
MQLAGGHGKFTISHILATSFVRAVDAAATHYREKKTKLPVGDQDIIPILDRTESGRAGKLERFSHYVARQQGFEDAKECPQLCKLAYDYLRKSKGCEDNVYEFFSNEPEAESLYVKLIEEFDKCIISYFAFHWSQAPFVISQVPSGSVLVVFCGVVQLLQVLYWLFLTGLWVPLGFALAVPTSSRSLANMRFGYAKFWVQLYNVPLLCITKDIGVFLSRQIGQVVEVDSRPSGACLGNMSSCPSFTFDVDSLGILYVTAWQALWRTRWLGWSVYGLVAGRELAAPHDLRAKFLHLRPTILTENLNQMGRAVIPPTPPSTESQNKSGTKVGIVSISVGLVALEVEQGSLVEQCPLMEGVKDMGSQGSKNSVFNSESYAGKFACLLFFRFDVGRTDDINGSFLGAEGVVASKQIPSDAEYGTRRKG